MRSAIAPGVLGALLVACDVAHGEAARWWVTRDFASAERQNFGGWDTDELATPEGGELFFGRGPFLAPGAAPDRQEKGLGLTVFPAFSQGQVAAFSITELWAAHPAPWLQPVWIIWNEQGERGRDATGAPIPPVFSVDVGSTFYAPFWWLWWFTPDHVDSVREGDFRSAKSVLDTRKPLVAGEHVLCPVVPAGAGLAGGTTPVHPFTRTPLVVREPQRAWVDGKEIWYLEFGADRYDVDARGAIVEAPLYVFVARRGGPLLPLPAILPDAPRAHSFVRRVDVVVPPGAKVFVPASWAALRQHVIDLGLSAPVPSDQIPDAVARTRTLGVATDASCFGQPAQFPAGCAWLDSAAAIEALGLAARTPTDVQLTVEALLMGGEAL